MVSRCIFLSRLGPKRCWLWVMTAYQLLAPAGFHLAVLQREVLSPWVQKCKLPMWSLITAVTVCVLGRGGGRHERRRGIFTSFAAEYPNGFLWFRYLFTAKKVKSDSAPVFIHFLPRLSVWGLSGVAFSKAAVVHLEADGDSAHFMWAAASCNPLPVRVRFKPDFSIFQQSSASL